MLRSSWKKELFRLWFKLTLPRTVRPKFQFAHPRLQILEDRLAPAVALLSGYYLDSYTTQGGSTNMWQDATLNVALPNDQTNPVILTVVEFSNQIAVGSWAYFEISINSPNTFAYGPNQVVAGTLSNNGTTWTGPLYDEPGYNITDFYVTGPVGTTQTDVDIWDTINLGTISLNGSGSSINIQGNQINFNNISVTESITLQSVEGLNFDQTGLAYTGNLNINQPPSTGQPFAGDQYISGPNWSNYGYAAGDAVTLTYMPSSGTTTTATLTIVDIIENNMYFTTGTTLPYGSQSDATIKPSNTFIPQIQASSISLKVTGLGNSITGAIETWINPKPTIMDPQSDDPIQLSASTNGGAIQLQSTSITTNNGSTTTNNGINLQSSQTGSSGSVYGTFDLAAVGTIISAESQWLTASVVNLISTVTGNINVQTQNPNGELDFSAYASSGSITINDFSPGGLLINSIYANQDGQPATVTNGNVQYNSTPTSSTSNYLFGDSAVSVTSTGPVKINNISATGNFTVNSPFILEGTTQSPNITAQNISLIVSGTGNYQGTVTFAQCSDSGRNTGDTLTLPTGNAYNWSDYGFAVSNTLSNTLSNTINIYGSSSNANNGTFTIKEINGSTLTLTESYVLNSGTASGITIGNGMIGTPSNPITLSTVPVLTATTVNGSIYINAGGNVNTTASSITANSTNTSLPTPFPNNVYVTTGAEIFSIFNISATGVASVNATNGQIVDNYGTSPSNPSGQISGNSVSLTSPYGIGNLTYPLITNASSGLFVNATATTRLNSSIFINNQSSSSLDYLTVTTYAGNVNIKSYYNNSTNADSFIFKDNILTQIGETLLDFSNTFSNGGSAGNVFIGTPVYASSISTGINSSGTAGVGQIFTQTNGIINGNNNSITLLAGSGIGNAGTAVNLQNVNSLIASTDTGDIYLTGTNLPTSQVTAAVGSGTVITYTAANTFTIGQVVSVTGLTAASGATLNLAGMTIATVTPTQFTVTNNAVGTASGTGTAYPTLTLNAQTSAGNISVNWAGSIQIASDINNSKGLVLASISSPGTVYLQAAGDISSLYTSSIVAGTLALNAKDGIIGSVINPLQAMAPNSGAINIATNAPNGIYLDSNSPVVVTSATSNKGPISLSAIGNITVQGPVTGTSTTLTTVGGNVVQKWTPSLVSKGLNNPAGVAVDNSGNLYIANSGANSIVKVNALTQSKTTLNVPNGSFNFPTGVAVDGDGNVYIADYLYNIIQKYDIQAGTLTQLNISGLNSPYGVALDKNNNVYVANSKANTIVVYNQAVPSQSIISSPLLNNPTGVAVDASLNIYVANCGGNSILFFGYNSLTSTYNSAVEILTQSSFPTLSGPVALAVDRFGALYITNTGDNTILKYDPANPTIPPSILFSAGLNTPQGVALNTPQGVAVDYYGNVYVGNSSDNNIISFPNATIAAISIEGSLTPTGNLTITADSIGSANGVLQTYATTINVTANYGGIFLSNLNSNPLTLTAAAVGVDVDLEPTNDVTIYSAGPITLFQESTALTQLATSLPIAIFNPGGNLTLVAGQTMGFGGVVDGSDYQIITSSASQALATCTVINGRVTQVSLINPGSGYISPPLVTFSGGGSGISATATITPTPPGQVNKISISNGGFGYSISTVVSIAYPGYDIYTGVPVINGSPSYTGLVIDTGTEEVTPPSPYGSGTTTPAYITLADLTWLAFSAYSNNTNPSQPVMVPLLNAIGTETITTTGGITTLTISAPALTIANLGLNGSPGAAILPNGWNLKLIATNGPIVFLNLEDTIETSGTISISGLEQGTSQQPGVAALGNFKSNGSSITISAWGNIALGTLDAGTTGSINVTSSQGAILINSSTCKLSGSKITLTQANQTDSSSQNSAMAQLQAIQTLSLANAAYSYAIAAQYGAEAQAAAGKALVNSFNKQLPILQKNTQALLTNYTNAKQTYTSSLSALKIDISEVAFLARDAGGVQIGIDALELTYNVASFYLSFASRVVSWTPTTEITTVPWNAFAKGVHIQEQIEIVLSALQLTQTGVEFVLWEYLIGTLEKIQTVIEDQNSASLAFSTWQANQVALTTLSASSNIAKQAYSASNQALSLAQTYTNTVQAQGNANASLAIAGVVFASPPSSINISGTLVINANNTSDSPLDISQNITNSGPISISADSAVSIQATSKINAASNPITINSGNSKLVANGSVETVTVAGKLIASSANISAPITINAGSSVLILPGSIINNASASNTTYAPITINAGNSVIVQPGSIINAGSNAITITANTSNISIGASVTVAGTLIASSATIGFAPNATGDETFNITSSATTPIFVNGNSNTQNTLNFDAEGFPVTITSNPNGSSMIWAGVGSGARKPVTITSIQTVNILHTTSKLTLGGVINQSNTMTLVGTNQGAGSATLKQANGIGITYFFGNLSSFIYKTGIVGDTLNITPFIGPTDQVLPWNLAVALFGGSGTPATLNYTSPDPYCDLIAAGNYMGSIVDPGVATVSFSNVNQVTVYYKNIPTVTMLPYMIINVPNSTPNGSDYSGFYTGLPYTATSQVGSNLNTLASNLGGILPTITYYSGTQLSPRYQLKTAPVNPGTYTIVADFAGNNTYANERISTILTINKNKQNISYTPLPNNTITIVPNKQFTLNATGGGSGNPVTYTIDPTSTPNAATISGNVLTILKPGTVIIDANQSGNNNFLPAPQAQQTLIIIPAAASQVVWQKPPSGAAGTALVAGSVLPQASVLIQDQYGNLVNTSTANVTVTASIGKFASGSTITVAAVNGVATFTNLIMNTAGTTTATAASQGLRSTISSKSLVIQPAAASQVIWQKPPAGAAGTVLVAGSVLPQASVLIQDQYGNLVNTSTANVTVTASIAPFANGSTTTVAAVNGVATFTNLTLNTAGTTTVTAASQGLKSAISSSGTIQPAAASQVVWQKPPSGAAGTVLVAGSVLPQASVLIQDQYGNVVNTSKAIVTVTASIGKFASGSTITVAAVNGVATFTNLIMNTAGTTTVTAASQGLKSATSSSGTIQPAAASQVVWQKPPSGAAGTTLIAGSVLPEASVLIQDQYGNFVNTSTANVTVTASIAPFANGSTTTVAAVNGVATFTNLTLNTAGTTTVTAASQGLKSATSNSVTIYSAAPVTGLTAIAGSEQTALNWQAVTGALSYNIFRGTTPGEEAPTPINTSPVTTLAFTDTIYTGLENGTSYYYNVVALFSNGQTSPSIEVTATPLAMVFYPDAWSQTGSIGMNWYAGPGDVTYNIYRSTSSAVSFTVPLNSTPIYQPYIPGVLYTLVSFTDTAVVLNTEYYYSVIAFNATGQSAPCNTLLVYYKG